MTEQYEKSPLASGIVHSDVVVGLEPTVLPAWILIVLLKGQRLKYVLIGIKHIVPRFSTLVCQIHSSIQQPKGMV